MSQEVDIAVIKADIQNIRSTLASLNQDINIVSKEFEDFRRSDFKKLEADFQQRNGVIEFLKYIGISGIIGTIGLWLSRLGY